jgi:hypothetical protein
LQPTVEPSFKQIRLGDKNTSPAAFWNLKPGSHYGKVQQLALSAFQIVFDFHPESQSAAGGAAVHRLLQLAETSGGHTDVQTKALSAFAAVVSDNEANQSDRQL